MNKILANAFSIQMVDWSDRDEVTIRIKKVSKPDLADYVSAIGHTDTANVLGVQPNRINVTMTPETELLVAQVMGGRLPEGCTTLPEGCTLAFFEVKEV